MGVLLAAIVVGTALPNPSFVKEAAAVSAGVAVLGACLLAPHHALVLVLVWLASLGTIRRLLLHAGAIDDKDPLLLVAPAVAVVLVLVAAERGGFRTRGRLANHVLLLSIIIAASAFNPLQGGTAVGLAGLLFVLVPLLWFWVGRAILDDDLFRRLLAVVAGLAPLVAAYGLYQVYRGFPPWDATWIESRGYDALRVGNSFRQFASFSAASEYVVFVAIGLLIWLIRVRTANLLLPAAAVIPLLGWALVVASVRGALVVVVVTIGIVVAASRGFGPARTAILGIAGLLVLGAVASRLDPQAVGGRAGELVSRSITGLSDPFDPEVSTLPTHIEAVRKGLAEAVHNPVGRGAGAASIAADRFGSKSTITELDPSNIAVTVGVLGVVLYMTVVAKGLGLAFRRARARRDSLSLAALAVLLVTGFQWLNGGNYAVAPFPWLVLGWLDRHAVLASDETDADVEVAEGSARVAVHATVAGARRA